MDFIADHAVPLSAIALAVLVLVALLVLVIAGLRLWRVLKVTQRRIGTGADALSAETERLSAAMAALPDRQAEVQASLASLAVRVRVLGILVRSASDAKAVLTAPLAYLGK
jgi:hypothetical protein